MQIDKNQIKNVFSASDINSTQKLVMLYIQMRAGDQEAVRITNTEFIQVFKFDWSTLNRNINALEEKGYISREFTKNTNHINRRFYIHEKPMLEPSI